MLLFKLIIFVTLVVAIQAVRHCGKPCARNYDPLCAFDGDDKKTFDNECLFEIANCESDYRMRIVRHGKCEECNKICTLEYNPVCATNGDKAVLYSNMCSFEIVNCESNYKWRLTRTEDCSGLQENIKDVNEVKCVRPCPLINLPVCGFNGENFQTFGNQCEYEVMNCISNNHFRFMKLGEC